MADVSTQQLKTMISSFRVTELQMLLGYAGKNKSGKKNELQSRALDLLKSRSLTVGVQNKIKELHRQRYTSSCFVPSNASTSTSPESRDSDITTMSVNPSSTNMITRSQQQLLHLSSGHSHSHSHSMTNTSMVKQQPMSSMGHGHHRSNTDYYGSMPRGFDYISKPYQSPSASAASIQYPLYPDVRLKSLPFYDVLGELLKPSSLVPSAASRFQESTFSFHLTPQQANDIAMSRDVQPGAKIEYSVQIQLRFCLLETSCEQDDNFPPSICVKVNSKMCPLPNPLPTNKPGVEPKRPSRPVNITTLCRISPTIQNQISISWASEYGRPYAVAVYVVRRLTSYNLLQRIRNNGIRNPDYTRAMIKEKLSHDPDSEISTMSLRGSLSCPLGKMRIQIPCRASSCAHVQCFDALLYLQMNEKKPTWICPVCDKPALFSQLVIDGLFTEILNEAPSSCTEVQFHEDGAWGPVLPKKESGYETLKISNKAKRRDSSPEPDAKKQKIECITIDSSDDEDDNNGEDSAVSVMPLPSTPVISSGSSSGSETPTPFATFSPGDSSSSGSISQAVQPINSRSDNNVSSPSASYYTNPLSSVPTNKTSSTTFPRPSSSNYREASSASSSASFSNLGRSNTNSASTSSGSLSTSSYSSMPILNPTISPFYSSNYNYNDFLSNTGNQMFNYQSTKNFDFNSTLNQLFRDTEISSYRSTPSASARRLQDLDPDIISIDD